MQRLVYAVFGALVLACALWGGWWWVGAGAQERAVRGWLEDRRAAGWAADAAEVSVTGFPNRFDMTVAGLQLADPEQGWAWSAPELRTFQLSYDPAAVILEFPPRQTVSAPGVRAEVTARSLRASAAVAPSVRLRLRRAVLEAEDLAVAATPVAAGVPAWTVSAVRGLAAVREAEGEDAGIAPHAYDLSVDLEQVVLPEALRGPLAGLGLPDAAEALEIDATAGFAAPLDLDALEAGTPPPLDALVLRPSRLRWGAASLSAEGVLEADAEGYARGTLTVRAEDWRRLMDAAAAAGAMAREELDAIRAGLEMLALIAGRGEALEVPLRFSGGTAFLGPIPIGAAPRMR